MTRQTSIDALNEIKTSGLLSKRRLEVYEALFYYGPLTANDLVRQMKQQYSNANQTGWNARFSELERMEVIIQVGTKQDDISGHECIVWDVTGKLPTPLPKEPSKKQVKSQLVEKIASLGFEIDSQWKPQLREIWRLANSL